MIATAVPAPASSIATGAAAAAEAAPPYIYFYNIRVENNSQVPIQLMGRHWQIMNEAGEVVESVPRNSAGVVGHQPIIQPAGAILYMSGAHLPTLSGSMKGCFHMITRDKGIVGIKERPPASFDAMVGQFRLIQ